MGVAFGCLAVAMAQKHLQAAKIPLLIIQPVCSGCMSQAVSAARLGNTCFLFSCGHYLLHTSFIIVPTVLPFEEIIVLWPVGRVSIGFYFLNDPVG